MAGSTGYKNPPSLGDDYESWRSEVELWSRITDLAKTKQAIAVTLTLPQPYREIAVRMDVSILNDETGLASLLAQLDTTFKKESVDTAYQHFVDFDRFSRDSMGIIDYIVEFERRHNKLKSHGLELPDIIKGCKLLDMANLSTEEQQIILSACSDLKYGTIKSGLKRIFSMSKQSKHDERNTHIKLRNENENFGFVSNFKQRNRNRSNPDKVGSGKKTNPLGKDGKPTRCIVCQSIYHYARECPDKEQTSQRKRHESDSAFVTNKQEEDVQPVGEQLFALVSSPKLFTESVNSGILDSGCSSSICGTEWLNMYLSSLSEKWHSYVKTEDSDRSIMFGDMKNHKAIMKVTFPALIAGVGCTITADVVEGHLPLLVSKSALKKAGLILDMRNDSATLFGKKVHLKTTSSGHYLLPLMPSHLMVSRSPSDMEVLLSSQVLIPTDKEKRLKCLRKLHVQFAHCSAKALTKLLTNTGIDDLDVHEVETVVKSCSVCKITEKPALKPVVGMPLASEFNSTVSMDLHQLDKNCWYLHIICLFSRFSVAVVVESKKASVIVDKFLKHWVAIFGAPTEAILTDNGGEFSNVEVQSMAEQYNFTVRTTASFSPYSNGICERHNQTLSNSLEKVRAEFPKLDLDTCLAYCCLAKNTIYNNNGFSPCQIVFGRNFKLPSLVDCNVPALNGVTVSESVMKHLSVLHETRIAYIKAESSEKVRRALRYNVRASKGPFFAKEKVYYRNKPKNEWKGPAVIIGIDGQLAFIRQGGFVHRVHLTDLLKVAEELDYNEETNSEQTECVNKIPNQLPMASCRDEWETPLSCGGEDALNVETPFSIPINEVIASPSTSEHVTALPETPENSYESQIIQQSQTDVQNEPVHVQSPVIDATCSKMSVNKSKFPKTNSTIRFTQSGEPHGDVYTAKVLGRGGKATGKYKDFVNIEYQNPANGREQYDCVDFLKDIEIIEEIAPEELLVFITSHNDPKTAMFLEAKEKELQNWRNHGVFVVVPAPDHQKVLSLRWVFTIKNDNGTTVPKARLVVRGCQDIELDKTERNSPVCSRDGIRMMLAICAINGWNPRSLDIKTVPSMDATSFDT